jgi:hypothetical protein
MEEEFGTAFAKSLPSRKENLWCFEKGNEEL